MSLASFCQSKADLYPKNRGWISIATDGYRTDICLESALVKYLFSIALLELGADAVLPEQPVAEVTGQRDGHAALCRRREGRERLEHDADVLIRLQQAQEWVVADGSKVGV